jgi:hypothetical protein
MPQPKKRQPVNNPDLERVMNDIRGIKQTRSSVNSLSTGTIESDALNAVGQSVRGTSGNPFRSVGNGNPYNPTPAQKKVSDDILGKQSTAKIINPFPAGTIEGDSLNAVGQSVWGNSGNPFRDAGNLNPYNPSPAQRGVFNDVQGSNNFVEFPPPLEKQPKLPTQPERKLGELYPFGLNYSANQTEDEKVRSMSLEDKLIKAMRLSVSSGQLSKKTQAELLKILNPNNLPGLALLLGVWGAGHLIGAGQVVDAFMLGFMLGTLGAKGVEALGHLWSFFSGAQNAVTQHDLKLAAEEFASFVSIITTEGLTAFAGAKGAEALKGLQSHVGGAFPKFKGLSPEQQKSVVEALEASRRTASKVGGKFSQAATEAKSWLDVALGGRKPATASNSGSKGDDVYRQQGNNGQNRGQAGAVQHSWREQLIGNIEKIAEENLEWKTKKVVGLVKGSIEVLENLRSFPVKNSKGKIVKVPFGSQGTNLAVQRLNNLAIEKILPVRKDIENLIEQLNSPSAEVNGKKLIESVSEYRILERSINAIDDHLRPDDLIGALRDNLGVPVVQGDRTFQHITEANEAINSLSNVQRVLGHFLQKTRTPNLYEVGKHGQSFEKSAIEIQKLIGQIIKQIEVIERDYKGFVDLKSYYQGYSVSVNAPFLNRSIRYQYSNSDLTRALQIARSSSIDNESRNEFRKTLAEVKKMLQPTDNIPETKKVAAQENIIVASPKVKQSRGFEMG